MKLKFTRSSRRQPSRSRAMHVIDSVEPEVTVNERGEDEYLWVGADDRGVILEMAAVVVEHDLLLILHVMPRSYRRK